MDDELKNGYCKPKISETAQYHITFLILQFQIFEETINCIETILGLDKGNNEVDIVVVDNGSTNDALKRIREYDENNIHILSSGSNLGFAKGNNVGYDYAKDTLNTDFIVAINSDTLLEDKNFINGLVEIYHAEKYHLLGPDIITNDGWHQNPLGDYEVNSLWIKKARMLAFIGALVRVLGVYALIKLIKQNKQNIKGKDDRWNTTQYNIVLQGSAIIFSPLWIKDMPYAFYPETHFYFEEHFLSIICRHKSYKTVYSPDIKIKHLVARTTSSQNKDFIKKLNFRYKNYIHSLKELRKYNDMNN